ncbi:MAG: pyridoxal phosphate-dependent aminotransferase [Planctomycetota bacterium]|nr:aspartate aminotransferase [Planctomycetota bacterium]MBL05311.1 aspartate aminotransferase [Planctomycetota bacterium]MEE3053016.1 pyridoxal phosphate-dependent aminotransferase [Planctomycetota bacterium]
MLHERARQLAGESAFDVLRRAQELEAAGREVIHLEIGQPDFPTPAHIRAAAARALEEGHTGYGPSQGLPELRDAIAEKAGELRGLSFSPEEVVVAPGAKALLFYAINALAGPGDEVIYPDPGFPAYQSVIAHSGATPVPLPLREETGFRFDADEFLGLVSDRTRLVILNSPQNPTGGVLEREDLRAVAAAAVENDFRILSDEIYLHFCYDSPFETIASVEEAGERVIIIDGFSKTYSMTGWRLGYALLPPSLVKTFDLYNVNIASCACTFSQHAAVEALRGPQDSVTSMVAEFRERRDYLVEGLNSIRGISCGTPGGAFYAFANITKTGISSAELASRLLAEAGVAVLSGASFGPCGEGYIRLSYATSMEKLRSGIERMANLLGKG